MIIPPIVKNFLTISSGVAAGQALTFIAMPMISRLYSPEDFGILGTATSLAGVIASVSALQYPQALVLPRRDSAAINLLAVSLVSTLAIALLSAVVFFLPRLTSLSQVLLYPALTWSVPLLVLAAGTNQSLQAWCVRRKAFQRTALSPIIRSVTLVTTQIFSGLFGAGAPGLIAGALVGDCAANLNLARQVVKDDRKLFFRSVSIFRMKLWAWHYRDLARHATMQNLISTTSISMPVIFFSYFGTAAMAGYYSLAMRTLQVPMVLVVSSLRQVLLQRMAEYLHIKKPIGPIIKKTLLALLVGTTPLGLIFFIVAPFLFSIIFGEKWREAGEYSRWLTPWIVSSFCNAPCLVAAQVLRLQKFLLHFEIIIIVVRASSLIIGLIFFSPIVSVAMLSISSTIVNIILIYIVFKKVRRRDIIILTGNEVI